MAGHSGLTAVEIGGERLTLVFDYAAIDRFRSEIGKDNLTRVLSGADLTALCLLAEIGLARHHPEWTADRIYSASPPLTLFTDAVGSAVMLAHHGPDWRAAIEEAPSENPPQPPQTPFGRLWRRLTGQA